VDVQVDKIIYKQSVEIIDEKKGLLNFISTATDDKGKSLKENFIFYLSDIDPNTVMRKTSGKKLFVSMTVNGSQKFIKHFREDKPDSYRNTIEILSSGADAGQELTDLFRSAIPLVKRPEKGWASNTEALSWLKDNIKKVSSDVATFEQSFSSGEQKNYLAVFVVKKTDQKGASTDEKFEFNILDINKQALEVKINGTELAVSLETNGTSRYIRYTKNGEQQNFTSSFEILAEDVDQARNIISALAAAIEKSRQAMPDFSSMKKSLDFISAKITDQVVEKKNVKQEIDFISSDGTKTTFTYAEPDSKGKLVEQRYEFYLNDIDQNSLNFKVSGGRITIVPVAKNDIKLIKYYKDNVQQDFQNDVNILAGDIESSRELVEAFRSAIKFSQTQPASWKSVGDAINFLTNTLKGEAAGTETFRLNFSEVSPEPLRIRYVVGKTDAKGVSTEQSNEFYPGMIDAGTVKITSSGKYLVVSASVDNKKSFVKVFKDGVQQSYDDGLKFIAFDSKQARDIAEAVKYVFSNVKVKHITWNDKQSAMKFITANVSDLKSEKKEVKQKIEFRDNDPCNISYTVSVTDESGKTNEGKYEFILSDMNSQLVDFSVSGKNVTINLTCKNKAKLVKVYKNGSQQSFGTGLDLEADDVETARNIAEAFRSAITYCEK
jgi:hypothetical protein